MWEEATFAINTTMSRVYQSKDSLSLSNTPSTHGSQNISKIQAGPCLQNCFHDLGWGQIKRYFKVGQEFLFPQPNNNVSIVAQFMMVLPNSHIYV